MKPAASLLAEANAKLATTRPPDFVATRNTLTKMLKSAGHAAAAKEIAARKRPSWASWAIAAVAVDEPDLIATLAATGAALARVTSSPKPANVRAKQSEYAVALGKATRSALDRLAKAGQKAAAAAHLRDIRAELREIALAGSATSGLPEVTATAASAAGKDAAADRKHKKQLDRLHEAVTRAERQLAKADVAQKAAEAALRDADALRDRAQTELAAAKEALATATRSSR